MKLQLRVHITILCWCAYIFAYAGTQTDLGQIYLRADSALSAGDYSKNLEHTLQALRSVETSGNCIELAEANRRLGIAYDYLQNKPSAWHYLFQSYQIASTCSGADSIRMRSARYIGAMYYGVQKGDSCIYFLKESVNLMLKFGFTAEAASAFGMMGEAYSTIIRDTALAVQSYQQSIRLARKSGDRQALGYALFRYGCHLAREGSCIEGKPFIDSSYIIFTQLHDEEGMRWALNGKAYAESRCGSGELVYTYMSRLRDISDSLFRAEAAKQSANYAALYEKEKQDNAIKTLEQRTQKQRILAIGVITGLLLLAAIGWLAMNRRSLRNKQRAEQQLYQMQLNSYREVLEAENKERKRIAAELHDSLGQLLSAARMQVSMADGDNETLKKAGDVIDEAAREVRQISHNLMPASLQELGLSAALRQLVRMMSPTGQPVISLQLEAYSPQTEDREMALYRMAQELLANSIRHGKAAHIVLKLEVSSKELQLSLSDDGKGFELQKISFTEGIGLKNIRARAEMMHGRLEFDSTPGKGSNFRIYLPL